MKRIGRIIVWLSMCGAVPASAQSPPPEPLPSVEFESSLSSEAIPPVPAPNSAAANAGERPDGLRLDEVLASVDRSYPLLIAAVQQIAIAQGEQLSSRGPYDLRLLGDNFTGAPGYYETNRASVKLEQNTLPGGKAFGGYRIGRGSFEPWYQERQTNDGGEFKLGFEQSLLQGRAIDKYRLDMRKADLARIAAEPKIDKQRIYFIEYAAISYWKWVAAGQAYAVAADVLGLAQRRVEGIDARIKTGILKEIESVDNRRLIVSREAKLVVADRKFQQAAVELSLYLRDEFGRPILPAAARLPEFPVLSRPSVEDMVGDELVALNMRPEIRYLRIERDKYRVQLRYAENLTLPRLNAVVAAGQDVGAPSSSKRDKSPFEMETGVILEVPLQRRNAAGQIQSNNAELARIEAELQYAEDRVVADVRRAMVGLTTAYEEYVRATEGVALAQRMQDAEIKNFELGNSNILFVNLREQATADARLLVIDALEQYFYAQAEYRAALGIDAGAPIRR